MKYIIYKITKPNDNGIYIGLTENKKPCTKLKNKSRIEERLYFHLYAKKTLKTKIYEWIDNSCKIEILEITNDKYRENYYIDLYKKDALFDCKNEMIGFLSKEEKDLYDIKRKELVRQRTLEYNKNKLLKTNGK